MDEFAMGSATENSALQTTRNPHDHSRIPGGSSGGSAAAVADRTAIATLGSDTGGSIRQPASHCGVVGLKPSYGRVSRYGLVAFASSLDQIGPLTQSVEDAAMILQAIAGFDPLDSTSLDVPVPDYLATLHDGVKGMKLGLPREYFGDGIDPGVRHTVEKAIAKLRDLGAEIVDISLPHTEHAVATYYIIAPAEASSNLSRFDGIRYGHRTKQPADIADLYRKSREEGFGPEVKRRIILGTHVLSSGYYDAYYGRAQKVRTLIRQDFENAFQKVDAIISPVAPSPARKIGAGAADPLHEYLSDIFTLSANLAGIPGISIPCGTTDFDGAKNLPRRPPNPRTPPRGSETPAHRQSRRKLITQKRTPSCELGRIRRLGILPTVKFLTHSLNVITQSFVIDHVENRKIDRVRQEQIIQFTHDF